MIARPLLALASAFALVSPALAADKKDTPLTPEEILKKVTWPKDDFDATVFASPPEISYPIFLSAAPDGTLFIGCDANGSLDRKPGRGKVVMARDTKGDGKADKFTTFAKMDSPRGVAWDPSTRTLYVMHPPNLTAYHDDNNTGVANRQEDLITGLGFGLDFRGADHTINGCRIGIDGWIYIACGDYGAVKATGKDGRSLAHARRRHRAHPARWHRARAGGLGHAQYPFAWRSAPRWKSSPATIRTTATTGTTGSASIPSARRWATRRSSAIFPRRSSRRWSITAAVRRSARSFIDEPSLPKEWAYGFYRVEWGRSEIDLHPLTADRRDLEGRRLKQFMKMTRATDLEVDGAGHLYAASWDGATFTYNGPNVGYVIRLTPKGPSRAAAPDFKKLTEAQLVADRAAAERASGARPRSASCSRAGRQARRRSRACSKIVKTNRQHRRPRGGDVHAQAAARREGDRRSCSALRRRTICASTRCKALGRRSAARRAGAGAALPRARSTIRIRGCACRR